jgi:hypothetical protein
LSFFANSSSSPVSRNVPYAEAKTPRAVIQRAFGDGVCVEEAARALREPNAPPPFFVFFSPSSFAAFGHRRARQKPEKVRHARAMNGVPNASEDISAPRSADLSLAASAATKEEIARAPASFAAAAVAGNSGSPAYAAESAGTAKASPPSSAGRASTRHASTSILRNPGSSAETICARASGWTERNTSGTALSPVERNVEPATKARRRRAAARAAPSSSSSSLAEPPSDSEETSASSASMGEHASSRRSISASSISASSIDDESVVPGGNRRSSDAAASANRVAASHLSKRDPEDASPELAPSTRFPKTHAAAYPECPRRRSSETGGSGNETPELTPELPTLALRVMA